MRVVERGSLSAAARDIGMTQPTVSRQMQELEQAYGYTLLIRTTRSLRLTPHGKLVYEQARLIVQSEDLLREKLSGENVRVEGHLRITAPSGFGTFVVAPFCSRFIERHPNVTIDLSLSDRQSDLISEGFDAAIRIGRLRDSSLYARQLATLEEVFVSHPKCVRRNVTKPADLASLQWIGFSGLSDGDDYDVERGGQKQRVSIQPRLRIDQIVGYREALLAGGGAGVIHRYVVDADVRQGRLIQLIPGWLLPRWPVHVLFPVRKHTFRLQQWCDELVQEIGSIPGVRAE
jgi:DNA-binding transcriptional LysR family regulator